jgi:hypothetical protein
MRCFLLLRTDIWEVTGKSKSAPPDEPDEVEADGAACYTVGGSQREKAMHHKTILFALSAVLAGSRGGPGDAAARPSRSGGVVYLNRAPAFNGAFTQPAVIVDGEQIGTLGSGECMAVRLPAGRHQILVRDQRSLLSALGLEIHAARIEVGNGSEVFVTVRPLQDLAEFNDKATTYDLLVADEGSRC